MIIDVRQIWEETTNRLEKVYERREAENISYILFEDIFHISKTDFLTREKRDIDRVLLNGYLKRLLDREPIQYVTGKVEFYERLFAVHPGALIPRPETEELVALILKENEIVEPNILEVGVGSGCIAISLALETGGNVIATDISNDAIATAKLNAEDLGAPISLLKHDVLSSKLPVSDLDILVSNPPYIPEVDKRKMDANVLDYEPQEALFVPDEDPLMFYKRIAEEGKKALKKGGKLYFEIHERFGIEMKDLLRSLNYIEVEVHQDMQGKDRMVSATNSTNK